MFVFVVHYVGIDSVYFEGRHPCRILSHNKCHKNGKYFEYLLNGLCHFVLLVFSMDDVVGTMQMWQVRNFLINFQ